MKFNNETIREAIYEWQRDTTSAENKYGHISSWDTSEVTSMDHLFNIYIDQPIAIGNWDVSNVTNMSHMFSGASSFNQPIGNWDVSNVTNMSHMFSGASLFNQPIENWDVSKVMDMEYMFNYAKSFNQPIGNWNVSKATIINDLLRGAEAFNQSTENLDNRNIIKKTFYDNGNIKEQSKVNLYGKKNGETIVYHENGVIKTQGYYNNDVCVIEEQFYDNGELIDFKEVRFNDDQLNIAFEHWKENSEGAEAKYGHISGWDTAQVTDVTDIYFEAKSINIDVSKWSLNFKRNGLLYKQTAEKKFTTYHENGKIKFEYKKLILMKGSEPYDEFRIDYNPNTKCVAYDEDGKEIEKFTVFYVPNRGNSMVIFKVEKSTPMYFKNFANKNFITDVLCNRNPHVINLTGNEEIDLEKHPPIVIDSEKSQFILDELIYWVPNKKFVMVYRFNRPWEDSGYEDYLSYFYEPTDVAVLSHYDKIFITGEKSRDEDPGKEITEFKCDGGKSREWLEEMCRFSHDYDELRIFEEEVFYNLKGDDHVGMLDIGGIEFKEAKRLNLNVDEYKKPNFI